MVGYQTPTEMRKRQGHIIQMRIWIVHAHPQFIFSSLFVDAISDAGIYYFLINFSSVPISSLTKRSAVMCRSYFSRSSMIFCIMGLA